MTAGRGPGRLDSPWAAAAALALLAAALFEAAIFRGRVFFERDVHGYWHPMLAAFRRAVAEGSLPLWNPYFAFGLPLAADPNFQVFYPPTWLALVMPPAAYFTLFAFAHTVAAGLGVVLLLRQRGVAPAAALGAGATFAASGPLLSAVSLFHHFAGAAWMPWVLLALDRALERRTARAALGLGATAAGQALAGSADLCLMTALLAAGQAGTWVAGSPARGAAARAAARAVAVALPFAFALAAVQWLPALALVRTGTRLSMGPAASLYWSLHPATLADMVVPRAVADLPLSSGARAALFEGREPLLASIYLGAMATVVATLGLCAGRRRAAAAAGIGIVFFTLLALGRHVPLLPLLLELPGFALLRYPPKYLLPATLLVAVLVGLGLEAWLAAWDDRRQRCARRLALAAAAAALVLGGTAAWLLGPGGTRLVLRVAPDAEAAREGARALAPAVFGSALVLALAAVLLQQRARGGEQGRVRLVLPALIVADLLRTGHGVNDLAPAALLAHRPPVLDAIQASVGTSAPDEMRVFSVPYPRDWLRAQMVRVPAGWEGGWAVALGWADRLAAPSAARWHLSGSYDGDFTGLAPPALSVLSSVLAYGEGTVVSRRLLRLGGVTHVVALRPRTFGLEQVGEHRSIWSEPVRVFRVPDALPRAYVAGRARTVSRADPYGSIPDPTFEPGLDVLVPEGAAVPGTAAAGVARIVSRQTNGLEIEVESDGPAYLVVSEGFAPGWAATVDGVPAPVVPANLIFRAVAIGSGRHRVDLWYWPPGLTLGLWLSGAAATVALAAAVWRGTAAGRLRHG